MDITSAAIATITSSSIATLVTLFLNRKTSIKDFNNQLDDIIKIAVQYPYLESTKFTSSWNENIDSDNEEYLRYENYCTLIFNYLERVCDFYNYNQVKIEKHINIRGWIRLHKDCWLNPSIPFENSDGYNEEFKNFINKYLS